MISGLSVKTIDFTVKIPEFKVHGMFVFLIHHCVLLGISFAQAQK